MCHIYISLFVGAYKDRIHVSGYSGPSDITDCLGKHDGQTFQDLSSFPVVDRHISYWWNSYHDNDICCNLNGVYRNNGVTSKYALKYNIYWNSFKGDYQPLKRVRMSVL